MITLNTINEITLGDRVIETNCAPIVWAKLGYAPIPNLRTSNIVPCRLEYTDWKTQDKQVLQLALSERQARQLVHQLSSLLDEYERQGGRDASVR